MPRIYETVKNIIIHVLNDKKSKSHCFFIILFLVGGIIAMSAVFSSDWKWAVGLLASGGILSIVSFIVAYRKSEKHIKRLNSVEHNCTEIIKQFQIKDITKEDIILLLAEMREDRQEKEKIYKGIIEGVRRICTLTFSIFTLVNEELNRSFIAFIFPTNVDSEKFNLKAVAVYLMMLAIVFILGYVYFYYMYQLLKMEIIRTLSKKGKVYAYLKEIQFIKWENL